MQSMKWLCLILLITACAPPQVPQAAIQVDVIAGGETFTVTIPPGSTAQDAIEAAGSNVNELDRSDPALFTVLSEGESVRLIRVREEFEIEEVVIPFETQILRNESLPEGEQRLIQPGVNGMQEITYRRLFEDDVEINRTVFKTVTITEAVPEVVMIGSQTPFAAVNIPGRLAYIASGNAWVMEDNTGNRRPIVTTGDLDGRIFSLSPDGAWLLFTRAEEDEDTINSLWVANVEDDSGTLVDLKVDNVIWFADWVPASNNGIVYSTVETSTTAPGWQANNDLNFITFSPNGWASSPRVALEPNSGGVYGWWGSDYAWSPDGELLAYARPDGVGLIDFEAEEINPLLEITPLLTRSDWAWMPGIAWSPDNRTLFTVDHAPQEGVLSAEESPLFDLTAVFLAEVPPIPMVSEVGMFAYPSPSPLVVDANGRQTYYVAYLQALSPTQSDTSSYQLVVMERDGSKQEILFPPEGAPGLDPQRLAWSPQEGDGAPLSLAVVYQGNLWLVELESGAAKQLTGDGFTTVLDWR